MPTEPRLMALWEDVRASLAGMSRANGYHHDYGAVEEDKDLGFESAVDYEVPPVSMIYAGESEGDTVFGGEQATQRFRRYDGIRVVVPIRARDGLHSRKALRVRADLHKALMATTAAQVTAGGYERSRGTAGRSSTFEARTEYGGNQDGGILVVTFYLRWDHVSGDMTTE